MSASFLTFGQRMGDFNIGQHTVILIWYVLLAISLLVQLLFYAIIYRKVALYQPETPKARSLPAVSVVIAARNEYRNLSENLSLVLSQDYPNFEVVVVNDGSWDDSQDLLDQIKAENPKLKIAYRKENDRFDHGKKLAITLGIKRAENDRLLFTDADCRPLTTNWIRAMVSRGDTSDTVILGYSPFKREKGFLNAFIRFGGFFNAMNYMGFALSGMPYMGVGRNLSYTKSKFFEVGGFKKHYSLASGDDDLFVNEIATKENIRICLDSEAVVETVAKKSWGDYWRQKRRHFTTGWRYRPIHKFLLALQSVSALVYWISCIALLVIHTPMYIPLLALVFRMLVQILIFRLSSQWLANRDLAIYAPLLEILLILMTGMAHIANATTKKTKWKN